MGPVFVAAFLALSAPGSAEDRAWVVNTAEIRVLCPLTVGGSFEGRSKALTGSLISTGAPSAAFSGQLVLDLQNIDTGIDLRNRHLRDNYLEVGRGPGFDKATLSDLSLPDVDGRWTGGKTRFLAQIMVHGVKKSVTGNAEVRLTLGKARVEARFSLRLAEFEIPPPRYLGVGVKDEIQIVAVLNLETTGDSK